MAKEIRTPSQYPSDNPWTQAAVQLTSSASVNGVSKPAKKTFNGKISVCMNGRISVDKTVSIKLPHKGALP